MKDLIPTVRITNFAGVSSIKDGMKSNAYSKVEREKPIPDGELNLYFPPEKCCVYSDEKLV